MMEIFIKCLIITLSVSYIVDISGIMGKINKRLFRIMYGDKIQYNGWYVPLFGCSRCLTFWTVLIFTLASGLDIIYSVGTACLYSYIANISGDVLNFLNRKITDYLNDIS